MSRHCSSSTKTIAILSLSPNIYIHCVYKQLTRVSKDHKTAFHHASKSTRAFSANLCTLTAALMPIYLHCATLSPLHWTVFVFIHCCYLQSIVLEGAYIAQQP